MASRRQPLIAAVLVLAWHVAADEGYAQDPAPPSIATSPFLQHMPVNSERRCVGVCAVSQALLQASPRQETDPAGNAAPADATALARIIYEGLAGGGPRVYPAIVQVDGESRPIDSPEALNQLSTLVTDLYQADYDRVTASPAASHRLALAQRRFVQDQVALRQLLERDPDRTMMFIGTGQRTFPGGEIRPTYHAFLLTLDRDGQVSVFDPNAPGRPWEPMLRDTPGGLTVAWSSPYRDTGETTRQRYRIAAQQQYFRTLFASVRALGGGPVPVTP